MYKIIRSIDGGDDVYFDDELTGIDYLYHALSSILDDVKTMGSHKSIIYYYYDVDGNPNDDGGITIYLNDMAKVTISAIGRIGDELDTAIRLEGSEKYGDDWGYTIKLDADHESIAVLRSYNKYTHDYTYTISIYEYASTALTLLLSAYGLHYSESLRSLADVTE